MQNKNGRKYIQVDLIARKIQEKLTVVLLSLILKTLITTFWKFLSSSINLLERETLNLQCILHVPKQVLNDEFHCLTEVVYLRTQFLILTSNITFTVIPHCFITRIISDLQNITVHSFILLYNFDHFFLKTLVTYHKGPMERMTLRISHDLLTAMDVK